ncbi:MAG: hypothetical protein FWC98_00880 [Bacteroidales bacterium]|nr:hypothetical protein [Bacteroidales bacterium]
MKKHLKLFALLPLFCGLLLNFACSRDDDDSLPRDPNVDIPGANDLLNTPWSELAPAQHKARLEQQSINFLNEMNALSNLSAIDAVENLSRLFDIDFPDIPDPFTEVEIRDGWREIFNLDNVTGIFTWNNQQRRWTETNSNSELRFVFPATQGATTNNATLAVRTENSGRTFTESWEDCWCEEWNWETWECIERICEDYEIVWHLPRAATATLTVDGSQAARIEFGAEYNRNDMPQRAIYRMTTTEGYELSWAVNTRREDVITMSLRRNNNSLLEAVARTDMDLAAWEDLGLDALDGEDIDPETMFNLLKEATASIKLMNDLTIVYWIDSENFAREMDALSSWSNGEWDKIWEWNDQEWQRIENSDVCDWNSPNHNWQTCNALHNQRWRTVDSLEVLRMNEVTRREVNIMNEFMRSALVSTDENFRIAEVVATAEQRWTTWSGFQEVRPIIWLRFNNNVRIEAEVYFGSGFDALINRWEDFVNSFDR